MDVLYLVSTFWPLTLKSLRMASGGEKVVFIFGPPSRTIIYSLSTLAKREGVLICMFPRTYNLL